MIGSSKPSVEASARPRAATVISPSASSNSIDGNHPAPSTITDPGEWPGIINRAIRRSPIRVQVSENSGLRFSRLAVTASTWLGVPIKLEITRRSSANCSAAPSVNMRLKSALAPRTPSGLRSAI